MTMFILWNISSTTKASTDDEPLKKEEEQQMRMDYYVQFWELGIPWYFLAAVDQYERNLQDVRPDIPKRENVIAIQFSDEYWSGQLNPKENDNEPFSIKIFNGMGLDGNGDGFANKNDDDDVLFTMATYLSEYGYNEEAFKLALWDYYKMN